ncbi:TrlF family AAA-like ATPase [Ruania halotolerans]|uniref:TrlF family AAA-like ATPase n=1 Tax=Ruania halotolerans TaxID=2897773 RepID=UPI001E372DC1|nr:hypothetical protein [Ruania halotolerans]UFU07951.1 hypothetical protein LQF10_07595 [Ruania halotolerans]
MTAPRFPRGSEWRKWDLHIHAPGTKLNDCYQQKDGEPDWDQFCRIIHDSDVAVVAIADYFSLDGYFTAVEKFRQAYPDDDRLLLPNLELRLPVAVNRADQEVNLHLIFRPTLTREEATKFIGRLNTEGTTGSTRTNVTCAELSNRRDFESATVSIPSIEEAIKATFGQDASYRLERHRHLLVVASAKGDGIRAGGSGAQRKALLSDEIDKYSDAFYANVGSRDYFLGTARLETDELIAPKPVFDGCDAHTFDDLRNCLGKHVITEGARKYITWIKADPTYEGLLQTLIEPSERVAIQSTEPDQKEPYKVISRVQFSGTNDFPPEIVFNRNLNAIVGSRSSGKSALLAFIAYAVDPEETVRVQAEAAGRDDPKSAGPAAGKTWHDVAGINCQVEWDSGEATQGRVIYIPQNSLYAISEQPDEITKRIAPALFRTYPHFKNAHSRAESKVASANAEIEAAVHDWFALADRAAARAQEIKDLGDKDAVQAERDRLQAAIDEIKTAAKLTDQEVARYQEVAGQLDTKRARVKEIAIELDLLSPFASWTEGATEPLTVPEAVRVTVSVRPAAMELPDAVADVIDGMKWDATAEFSAKVEKVLSDSVAAAVADRMSLLGEIQTIEMENADLIAKHEANEELSGVVAERKKQVATLEDIERREKIRAKTIEDQKRAAGTIIESLAKRDEALKALEDTFAAEERLLSDLKFGIEFGVVPGVVERVSAGFSQRSTNDYIKAKGEPVDYKSAQADPPKFLQALRGRNVTLNKNYEASTVAADVLTATNEVRFSAELDKDRIGGFIRSSMTPGKQALFALTLILNESQEPWPLLIDQPEDDLDSRSIYDTIVPYLVKRKRERQIIMVSHNANLVIGADAEEVVVANRHGADRPNAGAQTFEYLTGSLEHSQARIEMSPTVLGRLGIREHACEILDGGEEAFQKRREKYKI